MADYGDSDPEDAYDAEDTPATRLDVLSNVVADLENRPSEPRRAFRILDALRLLATIEHHRREVGQLRKRLEQLGGA
jgi:hypothetical protein